MDPKQTEGQNSGSGTLSTGANISRTMDALNVNERKSATSNSPFAKHHFNKVAPGTGDILIDPSAGSIISSAPAENKGINRGRLIQFGLIFGGIALIGLVIFTVVMVINNQPKKSSSTTVTVVGNAQTLFNQYTNYIVEGTDDTAITDETATYFQAFILFDIEDGTSKASEMFLSTSNDRQQYTDELHQKYLSFAEEYNGEYKDVLRKVDLFYYNYLSIPNLSDEVLLNSYNEEGLEKTTQKIEAGLVSTYSDHGYNDYLDAYRASRYLTLSLIDEATRGGCDMTLWLDGDNSCVSSLQIYDAYQQSYQDYFSAFNEYLIGAENNANNIIYHIYEGYYGESEEAEAEDEE